MQNLNIKIKKNEEAFLGIVKDILKTKKDSTSSIEKILRKNPGENSILSKGAVIKAYSLLKNELNLSKSEEQLFYKKIRMKNVRTISGVTPITVLTKPFPCPGKCIFCPNDVRMPKSYLSEEPGAQRAEANRFDPYLQTHNRLAALKNIGHPIEKVELIILGGTWSSYPKQYQIWFVKRCFDAMNDFYNKNTDLIKPKISQPYNEKNLNQKNNKTYNEIVSKALKIQEGLQERATWKDLFKSHTLNESGVIRCVGLVIETRPDEINKEEIINLRRLGATKVQIGIQSLSDRVLELNKRGHDIKKTSEAIRLLREAGFKIQGHWMPNLYGSSPQKDIIDYKKMFKNISYKPDELKIYPCSLLYTAELMNYYKKGLWKPYNEKELLKVLQFVLKTTPRYCRITRMIRDIPSTDIVIGNKKTNFRQIVESSIKHKVQEIRSREIKNSNVKIEKLKIKVTSYKTSNSTEKFIEYITENDKIAGFLRLSLPKEKTKHFIRELTRSAIIREIHVYGQSLEIGDEKKGKAQHIGLGKNLIYIAIEISKKNKYEKLSVISSVGTREYYRKRGFIDGKLYQYTSLIS